MKGWMDVLLWVCGLLEAHKRIAHTSLVIYPFLVVYHILESVKGSNLMLTHSPSVLEKDIELLYRLIERLLLTSKITRLDVQACVAYI